MKIHIFAIVIALSLAWSITSFAQDSDADAQLRQQEREAYAAAKRLNTADGWEIFINNYPESFYIEQARKMRDAAIVNEYCSPKTTLKQLVTYIDEERVQEPRIKLFYANLVNNPTHSYRYEHMDVGFNGCTGEVVERITFADGSRTRLNHFYFNEQGLLTRCDIMGSRGKSSTITYTYGYDNLHSFYLKTSSRQDGVVIDYEPFFNSADKLEILTSDSNHKKKWVFTYKDNGPLQKLAVTNGDKRRVLVYNDGYIIREETEGKVLRYAYDYDNTTFKKYLIGINEIEGEAVVHERKFDYVIDAKGRITSVDVTQDGEPVMTITRSYSN